MWWTFVYKYLFELLLSRCQVQLFATSWAAAYHSFLSFSISQSLLKCMSIELEMSSNHLILCHPLPALNLSQHQSLFQGVSSSHQVAKLLELQLQHQSFQWIFRDDFFQDWLIWSPCCPRDSQEFPPTPLFNITLGTNISTDEFGEGDHSMNQDLPPLFL